MKCENCKAQVIGPCKCKAGVIPYKLKSGHMGCVYNEVRVDKGIRDESGERFPFRKTKLSQKAAGLSDGELVKLYEEIYGWQATGVLRGDCLHRFTEDCFGTDAGMLSAAEKAILFEMARRFANNKEDAEEQGRLVVLPPVKIGDTLFYILNGKIYEGKLYRIAYENYQGKIHTDISADRGYNAYGAHFEDFGKLVFANREEAEKALEGMNNG